MTDEPIGCVHPVPAGEECAICAADAKAMRHARDRRPSPRTFDTTGTKLTRTGTVFTITCDSGEIANRVAEQLRTPSQPSGPAQTPPSCDPDSAKVLAGRLHYAAVTMQNDDLSEPGTEKRQRHITRYETLIAAVEFLERLSRSPALATTSEQGTRINCPDCGALLWQYPDGRETCSRCEYEQPTPTTTRSDALQALADIDRDLIDPAPATTGEGAELAPGCCSAVSPCSHQKANPGSICATCAKAAGISDPQTLTDTRFIIADEYEAGLRKMEAAGYEEFADAIMRHKVVIAALRETQPTREEQLEAQGAIEALELENARLRRELAAAPQSPAGCFNPSSDGTGENQPEQRTGPHRASGETNSGATGDSELTRSARSPSETLVARLREKRGILDNRWPGPSALETEAAWRASRRSSAHQIRPSK